MEHSTVYRLGDPQSCSSSVSGGKGAQLSEMTRLRFNVPPGFVIATDTFRSLLNSDHRLMARIEHISSDLGVDPLQIDELASSLRDLVADIEIPNSYSEEWLSAFDQLGADSVAVRSSGVMEDGQKQSFAGQFDSYLGIGRDELVDAVRRCWASAYTARSIAYRTAFANENAPVDFAVVIQTMIHAATSGVVFTEHPVTRDPKHLYIEAVWGLGESLVGGDVIPDTYLVNKDTVGLVVANQGGQSRMKARVGKSGIQWVDLPPSLIKTEKVSPRVLSELTQICLDLERIEVCALDIEWALTDSAIYILQCRPMTR